MLALCDAHEGSGSGIYYSTGATPLTKKPSEYLVSSGAGKNHLPSLGTPVPGPDGGFLFVYVPDSAVADPTLVHISATGTVQRRTLASTEGIDEGYARIGRYGRGYLVSWLELGDLCFQRLDSSGETVGTVERYPLSIDDGLYVTTAWNDMFSFSNGDVGWVYKTGGDELHVSRIALCR
jgi:hypothetical protein